MFVVSWVAELLRATVFHEKLLFDGSAVAAAATDGAAPYSGLGRLGVSSWSSSSLSPFASIGMLWVQLTAILLLLSVQNALIAAFVYRFIILPRQRSPAAAPQPFASPYLLGYGLVCPLLMASPFWVVRWLDLQNKSLIVASASSSVLLFFRCLEAMHGTVPPFALAKPSTGKSPTVEGTASHGDEGWKRFVMYYVATIQFDFDPQTLQIRKCTREWLAGQLRRFIVLYAQASVLFSVLVPRDFRLVVLPPPPPPSQHSGTAIALLSCAAARALAHLANNLCVALLTSACLEVGSTGLGLATGALSGYRCVSLNRYPITRSLSVSEFWSYRWNTLVGKALKRAVYVPLRATTHRHRTWSGPAAVLATFLASGLMHEYMIAVLVCRDPLLEGDHPETSRTGIVRRAAPYWGRHSAFFLWNGAVLVLEKVAASSTALTKWSSRYVPTTGPVRTALVVMTVLPVSHLFTSVYVDTGFYRDYSVAFPRLLWAR